MIPVLAVDLRVNQGSRFEQSVIVQENGVPVPLTGYTARMQIREWKDSTVVIAELTTENGRISISPSQSLVMLLMNGDQTAVLDFGDAFYDLKIMEPDTEPIRIMEGRVSLSREVTR